MAFKTGGRKCKFESLENRQMMAGDVVASVHAGTLFIKGDQYNNGITITAGAIPNQVIITGTNIAGVGTNVNGLLNTPVAINNVTKDIKINMKAGNDTVTVNNLSIFGSMKVNMGAGVDTFNVVNGSVICGDLKVVTGGSADTITITDSTVQGVARFETGGDCDSLTIEDSALGKLDARMNQDNDTITLDNITVTTTTALNGGSGINLLHANTSNFLGGFYFKKHLDG
jgi:hypothetical protein